MSNKISRRDFLKSMAIGGAGVGLVSMTALQAEGIACRWCAS